MESGFVTYVGHFFNIINTHHSRWLIVPLLMLLLLFLPFLRLLSLLITSIKAFTKRGRINGRRHDGWRRKRVNMRLVFLWWRVCLVYRRDIQDHGSGKKSYWEPHSETRKSECRDLWRTNFSKKRKNIMFPMKRGSLVVNLRNNFLQHGINIAYTKRQTEHTTKFPTR